MITQKFAVSFTSVLLIVNGGSLYAASAQAIGMASAQNGVRLDHSLVAGNATVFDGSTVETDGYSRIHLNNGTRLDFAAGSRAQVFSNRASLETGMSEVQSGSGFELDALSLKVMPVAANSIARVKVGDDRRVMVTALNAPVNVLNMRGLLVARVSPGLPLSFLPQAGTPNAFDNSGCVVQKQGAAILVDETGNQKFDLRGADLRKAIGHYTHVLGSIDGAATPKGGASQVVSVSRATVTRRGGCDKIAAAFGATTTPGGLDTAASSGTAAVIGAAGAAAGAAAAGGAAAGAGVGLSSTALIVGGVAAVGAAAVAGAAAAGVFNSGSPQSLP